MKRTIAIHQRPLLAPASRVIAIGLVLYLTATPVFISTNGTAVLAQRRNSRAKKSLTEAQRISHVLSRLTFGARTGDFERVKAMGVDEFIAAQLDPDSIDDSALDLRL